MDENEWLAERFEEKRAHLRAVAYRMLGSLSEADDAVQDAWERVSRAGASEVENLGGWLTTIVARVCLNMLRARDVRREDPLEMLLPDPIINREGELRPEDEALLADSVGLALQVVLDALAPAERLAFVLHDMFDLPFEEIAPMVGRSPAAARQLASRARRRVKGSAVPAPDPDIARQRAVVDAFFAAARGGDTLGDVGDLCSYNNPTLNNLTTQIQAAAPSSPKLKGLWTKVEDFIVKNALSVYVDYQPIVTGAAKNVTGVQNIPYVGGVLNYWGVSVPA